MELLTFTIAAAETKRFEKAGRYLEIIDALRPINLYLYDSAGGRGDEARNALSGLYIESHYAAIEVYSATAQEVTLLMTDGRGGSRRQPGIVSVTNRIGSGITQAEASGGALLTTGFLTTQVLDPAANLRGVLVRRVQANCTAGAGQADIGLIAAPVVPVNTAPANAYNMARVAPTGSASASDSRVDLNYLLPAGWGVWAVRSHAVAPSAAGWAMAYELQ